MILRFVTDRFFIWVKENFIRYEKVQKRRIRECLLFRIYTKYTFWIINIYVYTHINIAFERDGSRFSFDQL